MSVKVMFRKTSGTFQDYIWIDLSADLEPGRYRVCGKWFCDTTGGISDTTIHGYDFCNNNVAFEIHYIANWKIKSTYLAYNWFADIYVKRKGLSMLVLHQLPGISPTDLKLSDVNIRDGYNRCVVGNYQSVYMKRVVNDPYATFLSDVSLAGAL